METRVSTRRSYLVLILLALGVALYVDRCAVEGARPPRSTVPVRAEPARKVERKASAAEPAASASVGMTKEERELFETGRGLYALCQACHGMLGEGVEGQYPPVAGSEVATGSAGRFARILIDGMSGPVMVKGKRYDGVMPPAQAGSDEELAAVMTYVRRSFGNSAGAVTPAEVAKARAESEDHAGRAWTAAELERVP